MEDPTVVCPGTIISLQRGVNDAVVVVWGTRSRRVFDVVFHNVLEIEAHREEGMWCAELRESLAEPPYRRYDFLTGYESDEEMQFAQSRGSFLRVLARDMTVERSRTSRIQAWGRLNLFQVRDQGMIATAEMLIVIVAALIIGPIMLCFIAPVLWNGLRTL